MRGTVQIRKSIILGGALLVAILGGLVGWRASGLFPIGGNSGQFVPVFLASETPPRPAEVSFLSGFAPIVKSALPSVVNISSKKVTATQRDMSPFSGPFGDLFGPFWDGSDVPRERLEQSLGSGVIVSSEGYILTNNHVVQGASEIEVALSDDRQLKGRIIGGDAKTDLAVVKVESSKLPALTLGNSSGVQVGDFALAIGNPFGVGQTVTMGIVGAIGRGGLNIEQYEDFIQTDAAINPGNSGGALINVRGELIGINTAIIARGSSGNQGVGFAVPTNMARPVMEQILKQGKVVRGWLGVSIQTMTPELARSFGTKTPQGALVAEVQPDTPAAKAGLQRGDIVLSVDGEPVVDSRRLSLKISQAAPGTPVQLKLLREGREQNVRVTLGQLPSEPNRAQGPAEERGKGTVLEGLTVEPLTVDIARQLGVSPQTRGVVIAQLRPGTPAAAVGLERGDVIEEVNRQRITSVEEFERAIRQSGGTSTLLLINRRGSSSYVVIGENR
jgi:serine protease Do